MKVILRLAAAAALFSTTSLEAAKQDSHFRRDDLIVMGYVTTRAYQALDEFGMSSQVTADLRISRVLRGRAPSKSVTFRYIAHMDLPSDHELRLHLRRSTEGLWLVCKKGRGPGYIC